MIPEIMPTLTKYIKKAFRNRPFRSPKQPGMWRLQRLVPHTFRSLPAGDGSHDQKRLRPRGDRVG